MNKKNKIKPIPIKCVSSENKTVHINVCPACWHTRIGRSFLISKMKNLQLNPVSKCDYVSGIYKNSKTHIHNCKNQSIFN